MKEVAVFASTSGFFSQAQLEEQEATIAELRKKLAEESAKGTYSIPRLASFPSHDGDDGAGTSDVDDASRRRQPGYRPRGQECCL